MKKSYKIVSLGRNCFPKTILTNYGLKPTKAQGELTMPFDLCITRTASLPRILNNDFSDYFDDLYFDKKISLWVNKKYHIRYNHDIDCDASQKDKLVERFSKRIENFKQTLCSDNFIYFVLSSHKKIKQFDINNLYKILSTIQNEQTGGGKKTFRRI